MKGLREIQSDRITKIREATREQVTAMTGFDPDSIDWHDIGFSFKVLREACYKARRATPGGWTMREATAESSFGALLRAGVNKFMFDAYQTVPTIYQDLVRVASSNKYEELYAPLYNSELPTEVLPSEPFDDSRIIGLDVHVRNRKFGRMLAFERELVDDDMTGQITQRAANLGEMMRYVEELQVMIAIDAAINPLTGGAGYAYSSTGASNQLQTPGQLSQPNLELADIQAQNMVDPLGNFMLVTPDTVLVSPADKFNLLKLLNSTLQPSVPGAAGQFFGGPTSIVGGGVASGQTGWTMTVNPLQGEYSGKVSRFVRGANSGQGGPGLRGPGLDGSHGSCYLMQSKKSIVFQDRDALEVLQEAPNSGTAFAFDQYRYRVRRRFAVRVVDPAFIQQLN
jgi:hypothetical protein